jgi:hypothetical protein
LSEPFRHAAGSVPCLSGWERNNTTPGLGMMSDRHSGRVDFAFDFSTTLPENDQGIKSTIKNQ